MSRPFKFRHVAFIPGFTFFKPAGLPLRSLEITQLTFEEAEAIRLKDLEGLEQIQAAEKMGISRSTFQRVLYSAHKKIAGALLKGKAIKIEGGNFEISTERLRCANRHEWEIPSAVSGEHLAEYQCPVCNSSDITLVQNEMPNAGSDETALKTGEG